MKKLKNFRLIALGFAFAVSLGVNAQDVVQNPDEPQYPTSNYEFWQVQSNPCINGATPWVLGGNNIPYYWTNSDIGTCGPQPFIMKAFNRHSIFLTPSSYVGMGYLNSSPTAALDIKNSDPNGNLANESHFRIYADARGNVESTTDMTFNYGAGTTVSFNEGAPNSATTRMIIDNAGNVGIGTGSPTRLLSLQGQDQQTVLGSNTSSAIRISNNYSAQFGRRSEIQFGLDQNPATPLCVIAGEYTDWSTNPGGDLVFGTMPASNSPAMKERMRINSKGQVSIGKPLQNTSPYFSSSLLSVKGMVVAQEVIVTQQYWSDFVFDKNYKLMPLKDVETFYKKNHRLPDVPAEKQIIENGNDIGKTDAILLQKIEELTLYIVEQQKQIEKQQADLEKLKQVIEK